ncbi:MAG: glycosyltransferase family 4 protein [Crocinitomicaceae bacterium]|nr:glycosyltransferase family 4 protein [Crocinitomicaceae bacterium]
MDRLSVYSSWKNKELKKILIIGKVWPEPTSSAAGTRMMQLIHHFIDEGDQVTFVSSAKDSFYQEDLSKLDISCSFVQLNDSSFNKFIEELDPQIVIFDRFMTEEQFAWRVMDTCPNAMRVLNTEDLHFLREARHKALKRGKPMQEHQDLENLRSDLQLRELAAIYRSDISLMVSDFEVKLLNETYQIPLEKVVHLPIYATDSKDDLPAFEDRENFVFIGNFWHEPNWDAVRYLKSTIWPLILKKVPKAKLTIYGAYCSEKVYQLANERERFLVKGRADDALDVVSQSRVSLAPIRFGAGIKGKLLESMVCGTPSVTTMIGAEGMTDGEWGGFIEDSPEAFAERAAQLYLDQQEWEKAQERGFKLLQKRFTKKQFTQRFTQCLEELNDLKAHRNKSLVSLILQKESHQASRYMSIWIEEKKINGHGGS